MSGTELAGKVAVVTGAASGIGAATARRLAHDGAAVCVVDRDEHGLEQVVRDVETAGGRACAVAIDVSDPAAVEQLPVTVVEQLGAPADVLVNAAGVRGRSVPLWELDFAEWRRVHAVDLDGVFLCCRALLPQMRDQQWGRIVNVSSAYGKEGFPTQSAYASAKAGVIALGRSLSREVARDGVLVHTVVPGVILTPMTDDIDEEQLNGAIRLVPLGRGGTAEEVAELIFLLSGDRITFSTGATWDVSGGKATS